MLLVSRHLVEFNIVPANAVIRVNLAWEANLHEASIHIRELSQHVFLDVPGDRVKPPCHHYGLRDVIHLVRENPNVRYVGVSKVEDSEDIIGYVVKLPERALVVPKVESIAGCHGFADVVPVLKEPRTAMLDHDDLFHDLLDKGEPPGALYAEYITPLIGFCRLHKVRLLRTAGVVFSDNV